MSDFLTKTPSLLVDYDVRVGKISLPKETITSIELVYSNTSVKVMAELIFVDLMDMNAILDWDKSNIYITYTDLENKMFFKEFRVIGIYEETNNLGRKSYVISLQDIFSYKLGNCFLSKGYDKPLTEALSDIIGILKIDNLDNLEYKFSEIPNFPQNFSFVLSKNISALDYFTRELYRWGCTFYQDKTTVYIKNIEDLNYTKFNRAGNFTNQTINELSWNRIYDFRIIHNNIEQKKELTRTSYYDELTQKIVYKNINVENLTDNPISALPDSVGKRDIIRSSSTDAEAILTRHRRDMDSTIIELYVPGFMKNELNMIYDLDLKGNQGSRETQDLGDGLISGDYVSKLIGEKIIAGKLFQKIIVHRGFKTNVTTIRE